MWPRQVIDDGIGHTDGLNGSQHVGDEKNTQTAQVFISISKKCMFVAGHFFFFGGIIYILKHNQIKTPKRWISLPDLILVWCIEQWLWQKRPSRALLQFLWDAWYLPCHLII